jgi:hypothetical protein
LRRRRLVLMQDGAVKDFYGVELATYKEQRGKNME